MKASQPLRRRLLPLCVLPLLPTWAAPLWAQTAGEAKRVDDGEYRILHARYGTELSYVDVTPRLKELARRGRSFRLRTDTFGTDPAPGRVKKLLIFARGRDNQMRIFQYAEGAVVDGKRFADWNSGDWGQGDAGGAGGSGGPGSDAGGPGSDAGEYLILSARYGSDRRNADVTPQLTELARRDRNFRLSAATLGIDPDPGRVKKLRIFTRGRNGQERVFEFSDGALIDGAQFAGWGSGNWDQGGGVWGGAPGNNLPAPGGRLTITRATYGVAGLISRDITARLRARIRDNRLDVMVDNALAGGDPAPTLPKQLDLSYTVGNGRPQTLRVFEGERLRLP